MELRADRLTADRECRINRQPLCPGQGRHLLEQRIKISGMEPAHFDQQSVSGPQPQIAAADGKLIADEGDPTILDALLMVSQLSQLAGNNGLDSKGGSGNQLNSTHGDNQKGEQAAAARGCGRGSGDRLWKNKWLLLAADQDTYSIPATKAQGDTT
eukprot:TRINITY_DN12482_c0_g5_i7.p3 TRINITY_DN12482_c0_g5~~TRINITY_DN12482_c0_g5_i7.p3  ORF type:complete len:156 (-),score=8.91 TRINITY_DN12482_c0_g5_i7:76-543(-)